MGYLKKIKSASKSNTYKVIEKIPIDYTGDDGTIESTMAEFDYVPAGVQKAMHDIRNVVFKGKLPENSVVRIDNLTINVQINPQASNPQQIVVQKTPTKRELDGYIQKWAQRGEEIDDKG